MDTQTDTRLPDDFEVKLYRRVRSDLSVKLVLDLIIIGLIKVIVVFVGLLSTLGSQHGHYHKEGHHE